MKYPEKQITSNLKLLKNQEAIETFISTIINQ